MRLGFEAWAPGIAAFALAAACGSSDSRHSPRRPGDAGGEAGDEARGGSGGATPTGGMSGAGRGGSSGGRGGSGAGTAGEGGAGTGGSDGGSGGNSAEGGDGGATDGGDGGDGPMPPQTVTLTVTATADVHPISPLIYGVNPSATAGCSDPAVRFSLCRLGGNPFSTYNWENNASNAGSDRCHENNDALGAIATPAAPVTALVAEARASGAAAFITVPMLGHVAADKQSGTAPPACSGDVQNSGTTYLDTRFKVNRARKGSSLSTTPDTTDGFVNQDEFVNLVQSSANGARVLYALDNQLELWPFTHVRVHPALTTYVEAVQKNVEYATMIRDTTPTAEIAGFVGYGYAAFMDLNDAPDATGNGEFIDYYLTELAAAQTSGGRRLVDYLDIHWYSEAFADGQRIITQAATPAVVAERVQAPRSLWDSTYVENSWITGFLGGQGVNLIPWLKAKIASHYPGTKLSISEWNYGGGAHVSGAIAAADALGVFGREGIDAAAFESVSNDDRFILGAFRAFRNYDGLGAAFGDVSVRARSSDDAAASVYASLDMANAARLVIVAINKSGSSLAATINVAHSTDYADADVYRITSVSPVPAAAPSLSATASNVFEYEMPAYSVSVLVPRP